jgi:hypothetical protein
MPLEHASISASRKVAKWRIPVSWRRAHAGA